MIVGRSAVVMTLRLLRFSIALEFQFQYPVDVVRVKSFVFTSEDPTIHTPYYAGDVWCCLRVLKQQKVWEGTNGMLRSCSLILSGMGLQVPLKNTFGAVAGKR